MYHWIESIRIENGEPQNLHWHQKRMDETFMQFAGNNCPFSLIGIFLDNPIPQDGVYKARLVYNMEEVTDFAVAPYTIKQIQKFTLVEQNELNYAYKYEDRSLLDKLKVTNSEPIIVQQGLITDTTYSNLIFLQNNSWYTPSSFLLNGTMRQLLLSEGEIKEREIKISEVKNYTHFKMINAMMPIEKAITYPTDLIS